MTTSIEDSRFKVEKPTDENYDAGKFQTKMALIGKDLWEIVTNLPKYQMKFP